MKKLAAVLSLAGVLSLAVMYSPKTNENGKIKDVSSYFRTYEYNNHTYIKFRSRGNFILHDPDCKCTKSRRKKQ